MEAEGRPPTARPPGDDGRALAAHELCHELRNALHTVALTLEAIRTGAHGPITEAQRAALAEVVATCQAMQAPIARLQKLDGASDGRGNSPSGA